MENYISNPRDGYYNFNFNSGFSNEGNGESAKLSLDYKVNEKYQIIPDMFAYRSSTYSFFNKNKERNIENLSDSLRYNFGSEYNITSENATVNIQLGGGTKDTVKKYFDSEYKYADNQKNNFIEETKEKELVLNNGNKVNYYKRIYGIGNDRYEYIFAYTKFNTFIDFVFTLSGQRNEEYSEDTLKDLLDFKSTITDYRIASY